MSGKDVFLAFVIGLVIGWASMGALVLRTVHSVEDLRGFRCGLTGDFAPCVSPP